MARFYAEIQGSRGRATRMGTASSGLRAHIRGWNLGVEIVGRAGGERDVIDVYQTGGSNGAGCRTLIAVLDEATLKAAS